MRQKALRQRLSVYRIGDAIDGAMRVSSVGGQLPPWLWITQCFSDPSFGGKGLISKPALAWVRL